MPCYHPITAYQATPGAPLIFAEPAWGATARGGGYQQLQISCGQCSGCRLKRSREWAMRCLHEKKSHEKSCFITLTYNEENLPKNNSLHYRHFQLFMKRLRKLSTGKRPTAGSAGEGDFAKRNAIAPRLTNLEQCAIVLPYDHGDRSEVMTGPKEQTNSERDSNTGTLKGKSLEGPGSSPGPSHLRFYMCGEYGETFGRPHYHALIFGYDFTDRIYLQQTPTGEKIYRSQTLEKLWPHGYSSTADLTFESAAYVARYVMKKRTGDGEKYEYKILDPETGEIVSKTKEFNNMSRRPGIGKDWITKYKNDVYTTGKVIIRGHKNNPPRYYDKQMKKIDQLQLEEKQYERYLEALQQIEHRTPERLAVQEQVAAAKTKSLQRNKI